MKHLNEKIKNGIEFYINELAGQRVMEGYDENADYHAYVASPYGDEDNLIVQITDNAGRPLKYNGDPVSRFLIRVDYDESHMRFSYGSCDGSVSAYIPGIEGACGLQTNANMYNGTDIMYAIKNMIIDIIMEMD